MSKITLEICANSISSAIHAHKGGASRIELCSNLEQGGTTPSAGMILETNWLPLEIYVLIRPRIGNFVYSETEFQTILSDIAFCKKNGCEGVVLGFLDENGNVDQERTQKAVKLASPMQVTFHRAFDCVKNPFQSLETIIACGCHGILTSGLSAKASEGKEILRKLVEKADNRIEIMAGSGVNSNNVKELFDVGIRSFHASASEEIVNEIRTETAATKTFYVSTIETQIENVQLLVKELQKLEDES